MPKSTNSFLRVSVSTFPCLHEARTHWYGKAFACGYRDGHPFASHFLYRDKLFLNAYEASDYARAQVFEHLASTGITAPQHRRPGSPRPGKPLTAYLVQDRSSKPKLTASLTDIGVAVIGGSYVLEHAQAQIVARRPDIVVTDLVLEGRQSGLALLRSLQSTPFPLTPMRIVLTRSCDAFHRHAATMVGATHFYGKPGEIAQMIQVIRDFDASVSALPPASPAGSPASRATTARGSAE